MKAKFLYILAIVSITLSGQTSNQIKYVRTMNIPSATVNTGFTLTISPTESFSSYVFEGLLVESSDSVVTQTDEFTVNTVIFQKSKIFRKSEIQKDFNNNSLVSYEAIYGEKEFYLVEESIPVMNWQVLGEKKEFLGFEVQKAKTSFRGREYTAWFCPKIQISDGPWKFSGLPGLILEISSDDGFMKFSAYEIALNISYSEIEPLNRKYTDLSVINRESKKKLELKNIEKQQKYLKSKNPDNLEVKIETHNLEID